MYKHIRMYIYMCITCCCLTMLQLYMFLECFYFIDIVFKVIYCTKYICT